MSRLIYSGDLNKNFGEFFPTPYIDLITLRNPTSSTTGSPARDSLSLEIKFSLLFTIPEIDPAMPNNDINFVKDIVNKLQFYFIVTKSLAGGDIIFEKLAHDRNLGGGLEGPKKAHDIVLQKYKDATGVDFSAAEDSIDELSLLLYDSSILVELLKHPPESSYSNEDPDERQYDPEDPLKGLMYDILHIPKSDILSAINDGNYATFYTKNNQKILKVMGVQEHQTVVKVPVQIPLSAGQQLHYDRYPEENQHLIKYEYQESYRANINVLAFSSIMTSEELRSQNIKTNAGLGMAFGDVAYEKVLVNGDADDAQIEFSYFDANNEIYGQLPLRGLNKLYYKADSTNHKIIVSEFKQLVDRYHDMMSPAKKMLTQKVVSVGDAKPLNDSESHDPMLEASLQAISFALVKFGNSVHLLPRLAQARRTILDRSSGTTTGAFYSDCGDLLIKANSVVTAGTQLTRKLTVNAKIIDERNFKSAGYKLPNPVALTGDELLSTFKVGRNIVWSNEPSYRAKLSDYLDVNNFGNTFLGAGEPGDLRDRRSWGSNAGNINYNYEITEEGHLRITMDTLLGRKTIEIDDPAYAGLFQTNYFAKEEYNISFGYFIYDWQQHLINNSFLAQIIDVRRFQHHFGNELLQRYFVPKKAVLMKYLPELVDDSNPKAYETAVERGFSPMAGTPILTYTRDMTSTPGWNPETIYDPDITTSRVDRVSGPSPGTNGELITLSAYPEKVETSRGSILQHYLTERNMGFLTDEAGATNSNGKLLAFEFQNIDQNGTLGDYDKGVIDRYKYEVHVQDGTKQAMVELIKHYYYLGEGLRGYLLDASQECSYNNIDGTFNDFFAESMDALYSATPGAAPWLMTAVAYVKNVDLMTGQYNADETLIMLAARNIVQKISPQSGTLENLRAFYYSYIDFYELYYSESSALGQYMSDPEFTTEDGTFAGASTFATPYVRSLVLDNDDISLNYSNQSEAQRDAFISVINAEKTRYNEASDAYAEAIASAKGQVAEDIEALFAERAIVYEEKLQYEADRISYFGGCQYVWWWDAWNTKKDFSDTGKKSLQDQNYDVGKDEFSDIDPKGIANDQYGYVWIDPYYEDDVVGWYDVEKYGEPSYYAGYRRDKETGLGCRYIKRNYKYRPNDQRKQKKGTEKGERRYGGFAGSPSGAGKLYAPESLLDTNLKNTLKNLYPPEGGGEMAVPGFDLIQGWKSYEGWLNKARNTDSDSFGDAGYSGGAGATSKGEYTSTQQDESAMDQANTGFDQQSDEQTSNIGDDHVGRKMD